MPVTTVQKISTVMIMEIIRMKASPSGFMATARAGAKYPSATARTMAMRTCTHSDAKTDLRRGAGSASNSEVGGAGIWFVSVKIVS